MPQPIPVLVVGRGMYVTGRGIENEGNFGLILPTLFSLVRDGYVTSISFCATTPNFSELEEKATILQERFQLEKNPVLRKYPLTRDSEKAYLDAINSFPTSGAVILATPDPTHKDIALKAIKHGNHVMIVKPVTPTIEECIELIEAQKKVNEKRDKPLIAQVEYHKRNDIRLIFMREKIRSGEFGPIKEITTYMNEALSIPLQFIKGRLQAGEQLNPFDYVGCHWTDMIHFLTGSIPLAVIAQAQYGAVREGGINQPDLITANVEWSDSKYLNEGFRATQSAGWYKPGEGKVWPDQTIKVYDTSGREFYYDQSGPNLKIISPDQILQLNKNFAYLFQDPATGIWKFEGYGPQTCRNFFTNIQQANEGNLTAEGVCDLKQALIATALSEAVRESIANQGRRIIVSDKVRRYVDPAA